MRLERDACGTVAAPVGDEEPDVCGGHCGWSARARESCPRARSRDIAPPRERTAYFVEVPAVSAALLGPVNTPPSARFLRIGLAKKRPGQHDTGLHGTIEALPTDRQSGHERFTTGRRNDRDLDTVGRSDLAEGNRARLVVAPRAHGEEGMHEAGIPPSKPTLEDKALHTLGGPSHKAPGPGEKYENVSTAAVYRIAHWNRVGNAAVNIRYSLQQHARIVERDDGGRRLEQSEQGRALLFDVDDPPSSVRRAGDRHEEARP